MDISSRARLPLVTLAFAAALLAALTGASNHAPDDSRTAAGGRLAASSASERPSTPATSTKRTGATTTSLAPPVTMAVQAPGQTTTTVGTPEEQAATNAAAAAAAAESEPDTTSEPEPEPAQTRATAPPPTNPPPPEPAPAGLTRLPNVELEVLTLTNMDRGNNGVPPIYRDGCLDGEASAWAHAMAESTTMAHSAGGGAAVQGCRGANAYWGDNIGYWQPCLASEMEAWWMSSPSHRPHILSDNFSVVGIGVWAEPNGRCWFQVYFGS